MITLLVASTWLGDHQGIPYAPTKSQPARYQVTITIRVYDALTRPVVDIDHHYCTVFTGYVALADEQKPKQTVTVISIHYLC